MAYFSRFPLVNYEGDLQVNITRRVDFMEGMRSNAGFYMDHSIREGDTPEELADRFYDSSELAWVILMFNEIINIYEEWPKSSRDLESYIKSKYEDPRGIHHWESISGGHVVEPHVYPDWDRVAITNYEYEIKENDRKREIKLILPEFVGSVVDAHRTLMRVT